MIPVEGGASRGATPEEIRIIIREELERMVEKLNG